MVADGIPRADAVYSPGSGCRFDRGQAEKLEPGRDSSGVGTRRRHPPFGRSVSPVQPIVRLVAEGKRDEEGVTTAVPSS
jgi:hypothetical protein